MNFDTDKFISCIKNSPSIWKIGSKYYMDKNVKQKSWNTIGEDMFENWTKLIESEKENKVKELKTKWRHIRDHYSKFMNQGKSGDGAKKKKYIYAESLTFLQHIIKKRRTTGNFHDSVHEEGEDNDEEDSSHEPDSDKEISIQSEIQSNRYSTPNTKKNNKSNSQNMSQFQKELLSNLTTSGEDVTSDPDRAFLFSLLPDYKRLTYEQKTDFRIMTLQYFRKVSLESNHLQSTPLSYNLNQNTTQIHHFPNPYSNLYFSFNTGLGNNQNHNLMPQLLPVYSNFNPNVQSQSQHSTSVPTSANTFDKSQQSNTSDNGGALCENL